MVISLRNSADGPDDNRCPLPMTDYTLMGLYGVTNAVD